MRRTAVMVLSYRIRAGPTPARLSLVCGRYAASRRPEDLVEEFEVTGVGAGPEPLPGPDFNVAPGRDVLAVLVRPGPPARRELRALRWGLLPPWADDPAPGGLVNARVETAADRPAFRAAWAGRRCLLPADGYYEWAGGPRRGVPRQPYFLHRSDGRGLALAGLYEVWRDRRRPGDDPAAWRWTCAVLTTTAEPDLAWLHPRMPVLLPPDRYTAWLDPGRPPGTVLDGLPPAGLLARPVSPRVNDVRQGGPDLVRRAEPATLF